MLTPFFRHHLCAFTVLMHILKTVKNPDKFRNHADVTMFILKRKGLHRFSRQKILCLAHGLQFQTTSNTVISGLHK